MNALAFSSLVCRQAGRSAGWLAGWLRNGLYYLWPLLWHVVVRLQWVVYLALSVMYRRACSDGTGSSLAVDRDHLVTILRYRFLCFPIRCPCCRPGQIPSHHATYAAVLPLPPGHPSPVPDASIPCGTNA